MKIINVSCMKLDVTEFPSEEQDQFTTKLNSTTKHNQSDSDEDVSSVYIFSDFECTQDQILEYSQGHIKSPQFKHCVNFKQSWCGTKKHTPNLCVVQRVY